MITFMKQGLQTQYNSIIFIYFSKNNSNIYIQKYSNSEIIKIGDFGISKNLNFTMTTTSAFIGTPVTSNFLIKELIDRKKR